MFADQFLHPVGRLRGGRGAVGDDIRQRRAENRDRTREQQARPVARLAAGLEHDAVAVEIDAHAKLEVGFGLPADHGGQMEHAVGVHAQCLGDRTVVADLAADEIHARVLHAVGRLGQVQERDAFERGALAARIEGVALRQQGARDALAEKAATAGDEDVHAWSFALRLSLSAAIVLEAGRAAAARKSSASARSRVRRIGGSACQRRRP